MEYKKTNEWNALWYNTLNIFFRKFFTLLERKTISNVPSIIRIPLINNVRDCYNLFLFVTWEISENQNLRQNLRQSTNCSKGNKIRRGSIPIGYDSIGQEKKESVKKKKQYSHCRSGVAWQKCSSTRSSFRKPSEPYFRIRGVSIWFLDYRPRALKDLRDETHETLSSKVSICLNLFFHHFIFRLQSRSIVRTRDRSFYDAVNLYEKRKGKKKRKEKKETNRSCTNLRT